MTELKTSSISISEDVHASWQSHLPERARFALDLGAGSGRDAMALAGRGWHVLAVEPAAELRRFGEAATRDREVQWLGISCRSCLWSVHCPIGLT